MSSPMPALELNTVSAAYGRTKVLRDVSLTVNRGEIVALLGSNGAGKTTLLRTAVGLLRPTSGSVIIGGATATAWRPYRRSRAGVCLVPEGRGIFRPLTVRENLRLFNRDAGQADPVAVAVDAFPDLGKRLSQTAGTMSGGQQQMLALSRAFIVNPLVVLLDEVSMGLAPKVIDEIFESLRRLASAGTALLIVEQYVSRALDLAQEVVILNRGTVGFSGAASSLDQGELLRQYLGFVPQPIQEGA